MAIGMLVVPGLETVDERDNRRHTPAECHADRHGEKDPQGQEAVQE